MYRLFEILASKFGIFCLERLFYYWLSAIRNPPAGGAICPLLPMDTIIFDIETKNFFTDPGVGRDNFDALEISVVGLYSYAEQRAWCVEEHELASLAPYFERAETIVGFASNRYDIPVLNRYLQKATHGALNLWDKSRVDLLDIVERALGHRVSLSRLAEENLGERKGQSGAEAITMFREGRMDELKAYCLQDVDMTRRLFELWRSSGIAVSHRETGERIVLKSDGVH